jgi:hypothetical protein
MKRITLISLATGFLLAGTGTGIRPRGSSADYPARQTAGGITVAAAVIPPDQVKKLFATDLNRGGYIVVEVAIYPEADKSVEVSHGDFLLQHGSEESAVRPVTGRAIASILVRKNTPKHSRANDVAIYPSATVGVESGTYDPQTGRRRPGGVYTSTGVGVGNEPGRASAPPPYNDNQDPRIMQQELEEKALPEGIATRAIAGYLYFPKPAGKQKNAPYELTFYGTDPKAHLTIPPPSGK